VSFKEYSDKQYLLYIYKVNDKRGNPDKPSFVFKTSSTKARIASSMAKDGKDFMNNKFCFFLTEAKVLQGFYNLNCISISSTVMKADPPGNHGNRERGYSKC